MPGALPIDALIPQILETLRSSRNLVLEAPAGAGKTTRVPPALLAFPGEVLVLEPRRLAARMAARRVAQERGERLGETIGYQVRFEEVSSPRTRLRFLTEGVLTRRLLSDSQLSGVTAVVLDEFHERHLDGDLALALLKHLQDTTRTDLRLIVMSATLNAAPIAAYLGVCPVLRSQGRLYEVSISYSGHSASPLEDQVASAVEKVGDGLDGDILVFLPGAAEIRRAMRSCQKIAAQLGLWVLPLYGDLSPEEQDRAVQPAERPKLILSTNVAESSITIDGVTVVIDSGLARVAADSPATGLPTLFVQRISKASAMQRAGRAGRTQAGRVIRLYAAEDFHRRPDHDVPEIQRRELSQVVLELRTLGLDPQTVSWFDPPPPESLAQGYELLNRLEVSKYARRMSAMPVHPRLARMLVESERRGAAREGIAVAALLSANDRYAKTDVLEAIEEPRSPGLQQMAKQIARFVRGGATAADDAGIRMSILSGFPDRVARRRSDTEAQLASGRSAALPPGWRSEFLVALDIEDRRDQSLPLIRLASSIEPEWLVDLFPDRVCERNELIWNRTAERVEARSALVYGEIVIEETRASPDTTAAAELLAQKAYEAGVSKFIDPEEIEAFLARVAFAARHSDIPELTEADVKDALEALCLGLKSFAELKEAAASGSLLRVLRSRLPKAAERLLDEIAPERYPLRGRQVKVQYARNQTPWIASRLQDFFGLRETPAIARGQVPLLLHLLAPNKRAVQVTSDLAGFWERLYPQVKKELSRRYPKHQWP